MPASEKVPSMISLLRKCPMRLLWPKEMLPTEETASGNADGTVEATPEIANPAVNDVPTTNEPARSLPSRVCYGGDYTMVLRPFFGAFAVQWRAPYLNLCWVEVHLFPIHSTAEWSCHSGGAQD